MFENIPVSPRVLSLQSVRALFRLPAICWSGCQDPLPVLPSRMLPRRCSEMCAPLREEKLKQRSECSVTPPPPVGLKTSNNAAVFTGGNCNAEAHTAASELPPLRDSGRVCEEKKRKRTDRALYAQQEGGRGREKKEGREGDIDGGRRERLHLLDAPAVGSLPTSVSLEESK